MQGEHSRHSAKSLVARFWRHRIHLVVSQVRGTPKQTPNAYNPSYRDAAPQNPQLEEIKFFVSLSLSCPGIVCCHANVSCNMDLFQGPTPKIVIELEFKRTFAESPLFPVSLFLGSAGVV